MLVDATASEKNPLPQYGKANRQSFVQKRWRGAMLWVRRIHLYSGLFMLPWVLLYGFTGWFFNHPRYFTADVYNRVETAPSYPEMPAPNQVAARVVDEINLASFLVDGPEVQLAERPNLQYTAYLVFTARGESESHTITLHPITGQGEVHTVRSEQSSPSTTSEVAKPADMLADVPAIEVSKTPQSVAADAIPTVLEELGLEPAEAFAGRRSSSLRFTAFVDDELCRVSYNLNTGVVSARPIDGAPARSVQTKSFLQRLHMSRGYTPHMGVRSWWAIAVDAMFASMVFWGLSGVLMWWQIKRTRLLGAGVLILSLISATVLVLGMHAEISNGRSGSGGGNHGGPAMTSRSTQPTSLTALDSGPSALKNDRNSQTSKDKPTE